MAWNGWTDYWGHAFVYSRLGDEFVLVSVGKDGKLDGAVGTDMIRKAADTNEPTEICGKWSTDQILTSKGWLALCRLY